MFGFYFIKYNPIRYGKDYEYPAWGEALGFLISLSSMLWVPGKWVIVQNKNLFEVLLQDMPFTS